jgi:transcriptional regulator with XRE-family HTH domain
MQSADLVKELRAGQGLTQTELARRAGIARETLSRWESGAKHPSLDSLARVAAAAGAHLDVRLTMPEHELVALAEDQLELSPADRLKSLLLGGWPACRDALCAASIVDSLGVLVGPAAAALSGAPQRPLDARVHLLVAPMDLEQVADRLFDAGAWPDGVEEMRSSGECRECWRFRRGRLTLRTAAAGIEDIDRVRERARRVTVGRHQSAYTVQVAAIEDLLAIAERSPWSEDAIYRTGLRAVLACQRYWSDELAGHSLAAA